MKGGLYIGSNTFMQMQTSDFSWAP